MSDDLPAMTHPQRVLLSYDAYDRPCDACDCGAPTPCICMDGPSMAELANALREALTASLWRPIETAPRDGTRVLVCWQDTGVVESAEYTQGAGWTGAACFWIRDPTHWQPRPEVPNE